MKATFQIPDALYREIKAETAREGRTVREVVIHLFEEWLRRKGASQPVVPLVDWENFQPPLAGHVREDVTAHDVKAMRQSMTRHWNEQP
jgi:hypothetical protein